MFVSSPCSCSAWETLTVDLPPMKPREEGNSWSCWTPQKCLVGLLPSVYNHRLLIELRRQMCFILTLKLLNRKECPFQNKSVMRVGAWFNLQPLRGAQFSVRTLTVTQPADIKKKKGKRRAKYKHDISVSLQHLKAKKRFHYILKVSQFYGLLMYKGKYPYNHMFSC